MANDKPWYKKWWAITLFAFLAIIVIANLDNNSNDSKTPPTQQTATQQQEKIVSIFDLEALHGKNIEEIKKILGEPTDGENTNPTAQQLALGIKEWNNTFKKDNYALLVTYNVTNKEIIDFFIGTDDPSGTTKDITKLERILNIENSANFTIEPVKALNDPFVYTGINVVPKE